MDPVSSVLAQYGAVGLLALISLIVARALHQQTKEAHAAALEREQQRADQVEKVQAEELRRLVESLERERTRADRTEEELRRLNETIRTDYVSTISRASQAMADANRAVTDALAAVRRG